MQIATVVIPNLNGIRYLKGCLDSLMDQSRQDFSIILVDNGSEDESVSFVEAHYPQVHVIRFPENRGFCAAVNEGIRNSETSYVILLNNDTVCDTFFIEELVRGMEQEPGIFSGSSKMLQMHRPDYMDNCGDYYCALGWAFTPCTGRPAANYTKKRTVFSSCGGAAIYRRKLFDETGLFDEAHFAYLEDVDIAFRANINGCHSMYLPEAKVWHAGSGTSGSTYNEFKIRHSSRNSIYLIYKNLPWLQIVLNLPLLLAGFLIKTVFFARKGYGSIYLRGLANGFALCKKEKKVKFQMKNLKQYVWIQLELWVNTIRRIMNF